MPQKRQNRLDRLAKALRLSPEEVTVAFNRHLTKFSMDELFVMVRYYGFEKRLTLMSDEELAEPLEKSRNTVAKFRNETVKKFALLIEEDKKRKE